MYTSSQDFTLACAAGETGASVVRSATATSIISQRDAYEKALGLAKALAYEFLECQSPPGPSSTIYYSVEKSATAYSDIGYVSRNFNVTLPAGSVYSFVSQAAADAAAQVAAQVQANQARDVGQRLAYTNDVQVAFGSCTSDYVPYSTTITVAAGTIPSEISKADANMLALAFAQSQLYTALNLNCVRLYKSAPVTKSAVCSGSLVGSPTSISYPEGFVQVTSSQSAADSSASSQALSAAIGMITCVSGFYNTTQVFAAVCQEVYGGCWQGNVVSKVVSSGTYFNASQSVANSTALSAAKTDAISHLACNFVC